MSYLLVAGVPFLLLYLSVHDNFAMKWDMADYFFPYRKLISDAINAGVGPFWNPYQAYGTPLYSDPQSGFWYPITWLISLVSGYSMKAMYFEYALHMSIAGTGFLFLARRFGVKLSVAIMFAVLYSFNGFFISNAQHLSWLTQAAWLPWVLGMYYAAIIQKRTPYLLLLPVVLYMMLSGGYPAFILVLHYFLLVLAVVLFVRALTKQDRAEAFSLVWRHVVAYALFVAVSGGFLWSFATGYPLISRFEASTLETVLFGPFSAQSTISFVLPYAVAKSAGFNSNISMINGYMGLLGLIGMIMSFTYRKPMFVRALWWFGLFALLVSFGDQTPLREWLYNYVPGMDRFRFPAMFRLFFIMGALLSGAYWMGHASREQVYKVIRNLAIVITLGLLSVIVILMIKGDVDLSKVFLFDTANSDLPQRVFASSAIAVGLLLLILGANRLQFIKGWYAPMVLVVLLDMFVMLQTMQPVTVVSDVKVNDLDSYISNISPGFRPPRNEISDATCMGDAALAPIWYNQNMLYRTPCSIGFNPYRLSYQDSILKGIEGMMLIVGGENSVTEEDMMLDDEVDISTFNTERIVFSTRLPIDRVWLIQANVPGWYMQVNGERILPEEQSPAMLFELDQAVTEIELIHCPVWLKPLMWSTFILFVGLSIIGLLLVWRSAE